jgi:multidrug efflux pump subunit AcrA (membrane-fusion protein)
VTICRYLGQFESAVDNEAATGDDKTLWVLKDDVAQEIPVRAGDSNGRITEILEGPLGEDDLVITDQTDG